MFSPSSLEYIYTENVIMYPDLGMYLIEQGYKEPFKLTVYNDLMLGKDGVKGMDDQWSNPSIPNIRNRNKICPDNFCSNDVQYLYRKRFKK